MQLNLFESADFLSSITEFLIEVVRSREQPSASELIKMVEDAIDLKARWDLKEAVMVLSEQNDLTASERAYFSSMIAEGSLDQALDGDERADQGSSSSIDRLFRESALYSSSKAFQEMIGFMGRFRDYAPYNNMLVKIQNPSCSFYATEKDWRKRFCRSLKEDGRPMLILAPMHPVMLVYDLDQTYGKALPEELTNFAKFRGTWSRDWLDRLMKNCARYRIRIDYKTLSSTHGGFATLEFGRNEWKMRIAIHEELDGPSRFGILCHEVAHILLGHLGADPDNWWPSRFNLNRNTIEIEAEAVAYVVTSHLGLKGSSAAYVSRHMNSKDTPTEVSINLIAKVASKVEQMARGILPQPRQRV